MTSKTRSKIMSSIRSRDTKPELLIRKGLHKLGYRYRIHYKHLPGKPDIVFPKYKAIILVNGCFWHGHACHLFNPKRQLSPKWNAKISSNRARDIRNAKLYSQLGWKVLIIWECAVLGKTKRPLNEVVNTAANWLRFDPLSAEIEGNN